MLFYRPKPRSFHYSPRYYRQEKDPERRITFRRKTSYDPHRSGLSFLSWLLLIVAITLLIAYLIPRLSSIKPEKTRVGTEDVIEFNHPLIDR